MTKDKMVGWHHRMNGLEFKQAPGDDEGQVAVHGVTKSDTTEQLNNNNLNFTQYLILEISAHKEKDNK